MEKMEKMSKFERHQTIGTSNNEGNNIFKRDDGASAPWRWPSVVMLVCGSRRSMWAVPHEDGRVADTCKDTTICMDQG